MTQTRTFTTLLWLTAISTALLGISMLLIGDHRHIQLITDFYGLTNSLTGENFNYLAAGSFVLITVFAVLTLKRPQYANKLGWFTAIVSLIPLLALFGSNMWIANLGGFPAIGSGQGVIKYFALLAIGLTLAKPSWLTEKAKLWLNLFPILLVLLWIGGMKFTELEAKGIEALVNSSPLMAWMYQVWDVQTTSNLIGVYDLAAVVLLIAATRYQKLLLPATAMAGAVFVVTQTFLFSFSGALSTETILTSTGHFLIKDLWFIANLAVVWSILKPAK